MELYSTDFRSYDPQIGRFHQIDPLADYAEYNSPYVFGSNNPISFNDPTSLIDSTHETSTVKTPKVLQSVIIVSPPKTIKQKVDNAQVVIKIPPLTLPAPPEPIGPGGIQFWGESNGEGSTASPSDGVDKQPVKFGWLLDNFSMTYYAAPFERPNLFNPYEIFGRTTDWLEINASAKKAAEEKSMRIQKLKED